MCEECEVLTRRDFIKTVALTTLPIALPIWMPRLAFAPQGLAPRGDVLVCIRPSDHSKTAGMPGNSPSCMLPVRPIPVTRTSTRWILWSAGRLARNAFRPAGWGDTCKSQPGKTIRPSAPSVLGRCYKLRCAARRPPRPCNRLPSSICKVSQML